MLLELEIVAPVDSENSIDTVVPGVTIHYVVIIIEEEISPSLPR